MELTGFAEHPFDLGAVFLLSEGRRLGPQEQRQIAFNPADNGVDMHVTLVEITVPPAGWICRGEQMLALRVDGTLIARGYVPATIEVRP